MFQSCDECNGCPHRSARRSLGHSLDAAGEPIDHPLNRQVLSPELDAYRRIPHRIIAAGGMHKRAILLAATRAGLATTIVTDAESAKSLLEA